MDSQVSTTRAAPATRGLAVYVEVNFPEPIKYGILATEVNK